MTRAIKTKGIRVCKHLWEKPQIGFFFSKYKSYLSMHANEDRKKKLSCKLEFQQILQKLSKILSTEPLDKLAIKKLNKITYT